MSIVVIYTQNANLLINIIRINKVSVYICVAIIIIVIIFFMISGHPKLLDRSK